MEGHIRKRKNRWLRRGQQEGTYYHVMSNPTKEGEVNDTESKDKHAESENDSQYSAMCEEQENDLDIFDSGDEFNESNPNSLQGQELDDVFMKELLSNASYQEEEEEPTEGHLPYSSNKRRKRITSHKVWKDVETLETEFHERKRMLGDATKEYLKQSEGRETEEEGSKFRLIKVPEKRIDYDCESILSSYTNTENRPCVILPASIENYGHGRNLGRETREGHQMNSNSVDMSFLKSVPKRNPLESKEEKKERQKLVKALQSERRKMKKEVSNLYKQEKLRHQAQKSSAGAGVKQFTLN